MHIILLFLSLFSLSAFSKPYFDPSKVISSPVTLEDKKELNEKYQNTGSEVTRVDVLWQENESFKIAGLFKELSGTDGLLKSSLKKDKLGSYKAQLIIQTNSGNITRHSSLGTGREFRRLVRTLSFRFPAEDAKRATFILEAEHPDSGLMEKVLSQEIDLSKRESIPSLAINTVVLRKALKEPSLKVNFYAEGYQAGEEDKFLKSAQMAVKVLEKDLPGSESFEFRAVFSVSTERLGSAQDLGPTVTVRNSFLGLYFPYWRKFGRWYHVVYPTSETKYRHAIGQVDYDYPIALINDRGYWGVGNYKELTAIPAGNGQFSYLLLHEFGHYMGLNEEYEGGGPTELEFAPGIKEPWSQNITFNTNSDTIKWKHLLEPGISTPTSDSEWRRYGGVMKNPVGAYQGGYADSLPSNTSHKPVKQCTMSAGGGFCPVCSESLVQLIDVDRGEK